MGQETQKKETVRHQFVIEENSVVEIIHTKGGEFDGYISMSSSSVIEALIDYAKKISLYNAEHSSLIPGGKLDSGSNVKNTP